MFDRAIQGKPSPKYLSSDNDSLSRFHQWQANLRILDVQEIKTVLYVPLSRVSVRIDGSSTVAGCMRRRWRRQVCRRRRLPGNSEGCDESTD